MYYLNEIKSYLKSSCNFISVVIPLVLSVILWLFQPNKSIPIWLFILSLFSTFIFLWLFIIALLTLKSEKTVSNFSILSCTNEICLCEPNSVLSHDSIVSFYLIENGFENLIGYAIVTNVQENGYIQLEAHALPNTVISNTDDNFYDILNNHRKNIIIKTTINKKIIDSVKNN